MMKKLMVVLVAGGALMGAGLGSAEAHCDDPGVGGCSTFDTQGSMMTCQTEEDWENFLTTLCIFAQGLPHLCGFQVTVPCETAGGQDGFRFATYYCCP